MKKLPIYISVIIGYIVIILGIRKFVIGLELISTVTLETQETAIKFGPLIFISIFIFVIILSVVIYALSTLWKYFMAHKAMLIIPFLGLAIGFIQLMIVGLQSINTMIMSNANTFVENNQIYIKALMSLNTYTIIGLCFIIASVVYSILLKRELI